MNSKTITLLKRILKAKKLSLSLLIAIIVLIFSFNQGFNAFLPQQNLEKELTGKVSKVIDGDTIELLAKEKVKNGYAHAYESFSKKYLTEQADAKMFKLGLWQDERVMSPSEFR
ncbi:thermonuclease, partial [Campylobacter upsaliensis]|nr:thermonuclease [Campylobacter upsaliensis]